MRWVRRKTDSMGEWGLRITGRRRWVAALLAGALLLGASPVVGIVRLQQARVQSQRTNDLVFQVADQMDALDAAVGQVLAVAEAAEVPVSRILLTGAEERRQALEDAFTEFEAHGSADPLQQTLVRRARAFVDAVLVCLQEVATPGAHGDQQQVATAARTVLDPLHDVLQEDIRAEIAHTSAAAAAADRQAIWGSGGLAAGLLVMMMVVAGLGARDRSRAVHRATASAARRFESLISNLSDVITVLDATGRITYQSPSLGVAVGQPLAELTEVLHADDVGLLSAMVADPERAVGRPLELRLRHADRTHHWWETRLVDLLADPNVEGLVLTSRDVTERRALEGRLTEMAYHDSLTGLGNRTMLHRRLSQIAARTESAPDRPPAAGMLFFLDIDDFKSVNDTLGHGVGDRVLQVVADRLCSGVRAQELVVRLGGDEFGLVVGTDDPAVTEPLADRLLAALARPMAIGGHDIVLTASMGMAPVLLPIPGSGVAGSPVWIDDLLRRADIALYAAKTQGKGRWERFDPVMEECTRQRVELQRALREAVRAGQFAVHYQPVIDLVTGRVCSLEALLRWHRDGAVIGPDQFIHVAEDSGLIVAIGSWVLHRACHDLGELHRRVPTAAKVSVAVNVSSRQLTEPALARQVLAALDETGLPPEHLVIEVTETLLTEYPERARAMLGQLRDRGISVAVDDFGTGYSSLSRLTDLPVDIVKIDQSFVRPLTGTGQDGNVAIVSAILALAQSLALQTVAEGVETPGQLALLRDRSCARAQGFLFAEPMPFAELVELLATGPCWRDGLQGGPPGSPGAVDHLAGLGPGTSVGQVVDVLRAHRAS